MEPDRALEALLNAPKVRGVFPGAVERVYREQLKRHKPKEALKASKTELHRITGAFLTPRDLKEARALLLRAKSGDGTALTDVLSLHASTRERLPGIKAFYGRALPALGNPRTIADLACGLNPLYLGSLGLSVRGVELQLDAAELVNDWAQALGWDILVTPGDLAAAEGLPEADATLLMKLWPLLEGQVPGCGGALLRRVRSERVLVTFPTRTLSGRRIGMLNHYESSFEQNLPTNSEILDKFVVSDELCYVLRLSF